MPVAPKNANTSPTDPVRLATAMEPFDAAATQAALMAACDTLSPGPDKQAAIGRFVATMTRLAETARGTPGTNPDRFAPVGRAACERELRDVAKHARALAAAIERLHEPTILALAEVGFFGEARFGAPAELRRIVDQCETASLVHVPGRAGLGRKEDLRASTIARIAARVYRDITGRPPTFTTHVFTSHIAGKWPHFLYSVFQAMRMEGYGDHLMRRVTDEMRPAHDDQIGTR
jgi:hypothetical protein